LIFENFFEKSIEKILFAFKPVEHNGYFTSRSIDVFDHIRSVLLIMTNVWGRVVEQIKTHILCSINYFTFRKSCRLWDMC